VFFIDILVFYFISFLTSFLQFITFYFFILIFFTLKISILALIIFFAFLIGCGSNIILSLLSFIGIIFCLVSLLISFNIEFLSLIFLIIYIGAIVVLFLFVIFIINLDQNKIKLIDFQNITNTLSISSLLVKLTSIFILTKIFFLIYIIVELEFKNLIKLNSLNKFYQSDLIFFFEFNDIELISLLLYTNFSFYLILISLILLIAIIGSVLIVTNKINKK
jgi:NADH:ubiquinone oxidoreductase subunit 6 (subunit J)